MLPLTDEQQAIVAEIQNPNTSLIAVNAVSGAGKTALLIAIAKTLKPKNALYLAYNSAIATEARTKFPTNVSCKTTHSLAFANTISTSSMHVDKFTYREIKDRIDYEIKLEVIATLRRFCLSSHTSLDSYAEEVATSSIVLELTQKYIELMEKGSIGCTHEFYLKYYHMLLASKSIEHDEFDLLMLDEAGDLNPVTLAIFELLPAKKKIMVGDENQNIYSFNDTINGFKLMRNKATNMCMTKSFRVDNKIASLVEAFARKHMSPNFIFKGTDYGDQISFIQSSAYISRTNSVLIAEMIRLNASDTSYNLTRPVTQIFKLPLTLLTLKPGKFVSPEFRHLQEDMEFYYKNIQELKAEFRSLNAFLLYRHSDDVNLKSAISLIGRYGSKDIWAAYDHAKSHEHKDNYLTLCTAHSSKGLEFDHVEIADDLNIAVGQLVDIDYDQRHNYQQEEFRLYYVACTRAKKSITNAEYLKY